LGYVDYKNVIKWNLKNVLLCLVLTDPVTQEITTKITCRAAVKETISK